MVRHAPIHRRSDHSDIAICCGRNVRGSSLSTSVVPLSNQVTTLNHKRFKGFKMFSDGHLEARHEELTAMADALENKYSAQLKSPLGRVWNKVIARRLITKRLRRIWKETEVTP